jgi:biopolymer transport protein TolR
MAMSGSTDDLNSEINVTPMVDIMLVLLIIFMVTAPLLNQNQAADIDLPQVQAKDIQDDKGKPTLTIKIEGTRARLRLNGKDLTWPELKAKLEADPEVKKYDEIYIGADNALPYQVVLTAMAEARKANIKKVMLLTDPVENVDLGALDKNITPSGASK